MEKVNIAEKFQLFSEHWQPKILATVNNFQVKAAKLLGEFEWHSHEHEDEMFLVVKGNLTIKFRDRDVHLAPGEFLVVPHGVEHLPVAAEEVHILLFEPGSTINTGDNESERTVKRPEKI